jgi:MFS family permease
MATKNSVYENAMLAILLVILAFNYVDRLTLGLVLQDIKSDLHLNDSQLGLLSGMAFALFYSVMGIPIARWADRGNRVTIVSITVALWSAAVALCGIATGFLQLLLIRVGVAVGEAGCVPPALSLIADQFTREERPRAVARYMLGAPLAYLIGYFLAGRLNELYGWRWTFVLIGLPGLGLAALAQAFLREPRRFDGVDRARVMADSPPERDATNTGAPARPSSRAVCVTLWANRTFRHLMWCYSLCSFFGVGVTNWQPTFFIRSYGLRTGELGIWLALIWGLGGVAGTYWGGRLADRFAASNEELQLKTMVGVYLSFGVMSSTIYLSHNVYVSFALLGLSAVGVNAVNGPLFAAMQTLVPPHMRALSIAIVYLLANLIGMGLGPLAVGALSDAFLSRAGPESLRYALLAMCPGYAWVAWHFWRASKTVARDIDAVNAAA